MTIAPRPNTDDGWIERSHKLCGNCLGTGWVCENHPDSPWGGMIAAPTACECGAGSPCPVCSPELASAGYVERERQRIVAWLRGLEPSYSGWNDHDELYDSGYNSAIKWVGDAIEKRADTGHQPAKHGAVIRNSEGALADRLAALRTVKPGEGK